jgi:YVTN family beta-propeller protein
VIDTATNMVVTTVMLGNTFVEGVAVNPAGTRAYAGGYSTNNVFVIDTASNTVVATVPVVMQPT